MSDIDQAHQVVHLLLQLLLQLKQQQVVQLQVMTLVFLYYESGIPLTGFVSSDRSSYSVNVLS